MKKNDSRRNKLLAALPAKERAAIERASEYREVSLRFSLYEPDVPIQKVYFILSGVASVLASASDSDGVEVATIGNEGMVGLPAFLGADRISMRAFMQIPGELLSLDVPQFRRFCSESEALRSALLRYTQAFITMVAQSSGCNRMHPVEERCARWLLMTHDRIDGDEFVLTQEFLAAMLGVRRASVSATAGALQNEGLIEYQRGRIRILDRRGLEDAACECYGVIAREYDRVLGTTGNARP